MSVLQELQFELQKAKKYFDTIKHGKTDDPVSESEQMRYITSIEEEINSLEDLEKIDQLQELESFNSEVDSDNSTVTSKQKLAIVIGHCSFKEGACGIPPIDCEFAFNSVVAEKIKTICEIKGITCKIFTREWNINGINRCLISRTYLHRVKPWNPTCTVELHYNSGNPNPPYTVTLYARNDSKNWALALQDQIRKVYGRPDSQAKKVWKVVSGQNGHSSTKHIPNSALIEPFFGSIEHDAEMGRNKIQELAEATVASFIKFNGISITS